MSSNLAGRASFYDTKKIRRKFKGTAIHLNHLLANCNIDPTSVVILRHRPMEPEFRKLLPWLAAERPDLYNAYQQTQGEKLQNALLNAKYVVSCIGHEVGKALFVGLYEIGKAEKLTEKQFWNIPAYKEMKKLGMRGFSAEREERKTCLFFDMRLVDFYSSWKGRLVINWPPPERSWWRWAHRNEMPVFCIYEDSRLHEDIPQWDVLNLTWAQLSLIPQSWQRALSQWRGIYFIFDSSDGKGYVGSAYGTDNIMGRWQNYMANGHGGNRLLRPRNPDNFRFTILQRVSPDMNSEDVIQLESGWKERLHTRGPYGLNDN